MTLENQRLKFLVPLILLAGIVSTQYYFDARKVIKSPAPLTIIPSRAVRLGDLGLHSAAAALMWLYAVQEVNISNMPKFPELIKSINGIDPKFSYPYAFSALILPSFGLKEDAIEIAKEGIKNADPDWRIPYYMATTYHIYFKDRKNAALYFDMASTTPGVPENIKSISTRYGTSESALEQTKQIWTTIYETSNDELVIERAKNYIIHLEMMEALEKAASIYSKKYGHYPPSIESLVTSKIIKMIPESPLGVKFSIKENRIFTEFTE